MVQEAGACAGVIAGCEAAAAACAMGLSACLVTVHLETIAQMSCNPAVGGLAKGQLVREVDALGGEMAKVTDETAIQFRMLNVKKGPAVHSPRAQVDRLLVQEGLSRDLRGDIIYAVGRKVGPLRERFPVELYTSF
jgi:tRNA uridine 5-carboxymethylaminomethyl modification enzyme